jgi:hypothetical protein
MSDFWDSLSTLGTETLQKVSAPISTGIARSFSNIIQGTQLKVQAVTDKIVAGTDPKKNANSPAIPPTTGSTVKTTPITIAGVQISFVFAAVAIAAAIYFMTRRGGS